MEEAEKFDYKKLEVVYEDNHIIVVVKPQNVPTQADSSQDLDMLSAVKQYLVEKNNKPGDAYVGMVQRLDRPTGGVMVFAKTSKAASRLCEEIVDGTLEKKYFCVTCTEPKEKNGVLNHYIKKNEMTNKVLVVPMMTDGSKKAELEYSVLETVQGFSLVKVHLITGRSHQIRVQLASIGCPIFGDLKYGADPKTCRHNLGLWATELKLVHPTTKQIMTFIVYPPKEEIPWKAFNIALHLNIGIAVSPYEQLAAKANFYKAEEKDESSRTSSGYKNNR